MRKELLLDLLLLSLALNIPAFAGSSDTPSGPVEKVLYAFTGVPDGVNPVGGLIRDAAGHFYGVTSLGGTSGIVNTGACSASGGCGTVFELANVAGKWEEKVLYNFCPINPCSDAMNPSSALVMDGLGNLYGETSHGGQFNQGSVFELEKLPHGQWHEIVLYSFCADNVNGGCLDGWVPSGGLTFDSAGNLYGTTQMGGFEGGGAWGVVFELSPSGSGWQETVICAFLSSVCPTGVKPLAGVTLDASGNLYGTTENGGNSSGAGTAFELSQPTSGDWVYTNLYEFCPLSGCSDGEYPAGGLSFDGSGNLYGTANLGGTKNSGVIFELAPNGDGSWDYSVLHNFCSAANCTDGAFPAYNLILDAAGNIYGIATGGNGTPRAAYRLSRKGLGWQELVLHTFCVQSGDGCTPSGTLLLSNRALYGVTSDGGTSDAGTVYAITQ